MSFAHSLTIPWDISILILLMATLGVSIASVHWLRHAYSSHRYFARIGVWCVGLVSTSAFLVLIYGSFIEPQLITVTNVSLPFPTQKPLRIVVISDLHMGPYKGARYLARVVRKINTLLPDIVLIAGDLVLTEEVEPDILPSFRALADIRTSIGTYAVMGNHDHGIYRRARNTPHPDDRSELLENELLSNRVTVLRNEPVFVRLADSTIAIAGLEDALSGNADIVQTFALIPKDMPVILVSHNPDVILDPASAKATLIVSGHTHAGQIRLPWYGPLATLPTRLGRRYDQGLFPLDSGGTLAITRGIGESGPRARLFAPPEILLIDTVPSLSI